ncbi:hypothetical protein Sinac_4512 [Singulisphaera acidiphila DSM 18658]|uniref:Uncharacterized protein n=1 Tax=Singulisphaera acidiphila (strain ATCC BAA-1392 / DSM 18658 / VKM B-2454 / MOB10) TaxID=886293 RepID=L0DIL1_SINAD|nr:hypothetical protein Sinac_4512 [Singulisphaera acidiphila DSM 18658]
MRFSRELRIDMLGIVDWMAVEGGRARATPTNDEVSSRPEPRSTNLQKARVMARGAMCRLTVETGGHDAEGRGLSKALSE